MKKLTYSLIFSLIGLSAFGQIKITNEGTPGSAEASSVLDVASDGTKGALLPRMTTAQRTAISSPATGLLVFDTDKNTIYSYNGTKWTSMVNSGALADSPTIDTIADASGTNVLGFKLARNSATSGQVLTWNGTDWAPATPASGGGGGGNATLGTGFVSAGIPPSGAENTLAGIGSGNALTTGSNNTFLGAGAGNTVSSGSNNIVIGANNQASGATGTGNNEINIGDFLKAYRFNTDNAGALDSAYFSINTTPVRGEALRVVGNTTINEGNLDIKGGSLGLSKQNSICGNETATTSGFSVTIPESWNVVAVNDYMVMYTRTSGAASVSIYVTKSITDVLLKASAGVNVDYCLIRLN